MIGRKPDRRTFLETVGAAAALTLGCDARAQSGAERVSGMTKTSYENTSNGDFVIDRHPGLENVWVPGGGSGHGFKHGPAVGEYTAERVLKGGDGEPRFSLATKGMVQKRVVQ